MPRLEEQERVQKVRDQYINYKKNLQCSHCGTNDYRVLEFHHLGLKKHNIGSMVGQGYNWNRIERELLKCIPLCCNCHTIEHWTD